MSEGDIFWYDVVQRITERKFRQPCFPSLEHIGHTVQRTHIHTACQRLIRLKSTYNSMFFLASFTTKTTCGLALLSFALQFDEIWHGSILLNRQLDAALDLLVCGNVSRFD